MKHQRLKQKTARLAARFSLGFISMVVNTFPEAMLSPSCPLLGRVVFWLSKKRRNRTIINLTAVFKDEKSPEEIERMAQQVFCKIAEDWLEAAILALKKKERGKRWRESISVEGAEHLDEALKGKKGVICVTAHFGIFLLMTARLSLAGYPCNLIVKFSDHLIFAEIWQRLMRQMETRWIPLHPKVKTVSESLRWLRSGGILFVFADHYRKDGVEVDFFNRPAGTVEGPAVFHLKTEAPILCAFIIKLGRKQHKIIITPPIAVDKTGNREEDVCQITKTFSKIIEDFVKEYPEQWWWVIKRWSKKYL